MCNLAGKGSGAGTGPGASETARTGPREGLKAPGAALPGTEPSLWPDTAQEPLGRREMFISPCLVPGLWRKQKGWERREHPHSERGENQLQTGGVHHPGGIGSLLPSALTFILAAVLRWRERIWDKRCLGCSANKPPKSLTKTEAKCIEIIHRSFC